MAQLLLPVDAGLEDTSTVFWSPGADRDLQDGMAGLSAQVVEYARDALGAGGADRAACDIVIDYLARIRIHAERAWFVASAAAMAGDSAATVLRRAQAAVELRYWGTLILDDVADRSTTRCGAPTLHRRVGEMEAVYLGELLLAAGHGELIRFLEDRNPPPSLLFEMLHEWDRVHLGVNSAQYLDLALSDAAIEDVSPDDALRLIEGTTGVELANCFYVGGTASTLDGDALAALQRLGMIVGVLMQIRDDCLDYVDDPELINKEPLLDIRNGRKKVAVVVGYHHAEPRQRGEIVDLAGRADRLAAPERARLRELIFNPLASSYLEELRNRLLAEAQDILADTRWRPEAADRVRRFLLA